MIEFTVGLIITLMSLMAVLLSFLYDEEDLRSSLRLVFGVLGVVGLLILIVGYAKHVWNF